MKRYIPISLFIAAAFSVGAQETPRWLRDAAISPDGKTIAFSYKGDIFTVSSSGGPAVQITSDKGYDANPVWSPNGKQLVFMSTREGSDDIFITSAYGGTPRRLTTSSGNEKPLTFVNDSTLIFNASNLPGRLTSRAPFLTQIYSINILKETPRPHLYLSLPVVSASANRAGELLYQDRKGYEDILRKHERSSGTADVWLYSDGNFKQLTDFNGGDQSPVWGKDGVYYYVSEEDGTLNIFQGNISNPSDKKQLTTFTKHPVRSLTSSEDGLLAFSWDGDLYTMRPGSEPRKLDIRVRTDNYDNDLVKRYVSGGVSNIAVSPKGEEVAIILRGELYVTDTKYKTTRRITDTPAQERSVSFSPDGRTLVFDSDVDGIWQLFTAKIKDDKEKQFAYATDVEIEPLYKCPTSAMQPVFSPDGKKVAFLEDRTTLKIIDVKSKKVTTALDGRYNYSYSDGDIPFEWSPDSKWLLVSYLGETGWNNIDIALVKADGSEVVNLTESGHTASEPKWALDGRAITFTTSKYGMKSQGSWGAQEDIVFMALDGEAWDRINMTEEEAALAEEADKDDKKSDEKKKEERSKAPFELDSRRYRTRRLTLNSSRIWDYYLDPKGENLYYVAGSTEGKYNLFKKDLKKGETKVWHYDLSGGLVPFDNGESIFVFNGSSIKKLNLSNSSTEDVTFEAPYDRRPSLERAYIFDHMAKQVEDKFYDEKLHGVDWKYYVDHYRKFLPYISNNRDFATLLSEILGELNASHTGGRYYGNGAPMQTALLGAYFDEDYDGPGLKISEIFPRGPLGARKAGVTVGDIILTIDGEEIKADTDYLPLLEGKAGKKVRLGVKKAGGKMFYTVVRPISAGTQSSLAYDRWVERNEQIVDSLSGGKIGYVHVRGMDGSSYQTVYDRILGKYRDCDAVVVDTRFNGGGWLHNDLAILLSGKEYVTFRPRGREIGHEPFSQWTKPSVMLVNESNYSDAHGSPYAYQYLGLGDVVGAPIPGTMTAVWWETQIDPSIIFGIPQVTNVSPDGTVLENHQLNPDLIIYNQPADIERGIDAQLEGAVRHLQSKIKK